MDKKFLGVLAAIVIALVGVFIFSKNSGNNSTGNSSVQPTNHIEGKGKAGVTLVEYGDYECPICGSYYPAVKQAVAQLSSQIHFQFRNLPLVSIHPNALAGARAAEAAANQNKFWQMHDLLYDNQDQSGQSGWVASRDPLNQYFVQFAQQLGLNLNQFKSDYASAATNDKISADINAFLGTSYANHNASKEATPTFFLDGQYINNSDFSDQTANGFIPSANKIVSRVQADISKH